MELGIYFILFNLLSICLVKCQTYRTDYEYNKKEDAFYKLHIESKPGYIVEKLCEAEGAKLVGTDRQDLIMVHTILKKYPDLGPMVWIVSDSASHEAEEDEEALIEMVSESSNYGKGCEVMTRNGEIESQLCSKLYPFACKIAAKKITYDNKCDVYSSDFTYYPETGSCYKVSKDVLSWDEAYEDCKAVGAHLAVINSEVESLLLKQFFVTYGMNRLSYHSWYLIIGFRAISPSREFRTIFNQTLEEAGFNEWSYTEPNNYNDSEYCGSIFKSDGKLNDVNCIHKYAFICEKEVGVVST